MTFFNFTQETAQYSGHILQVTVVGAKDIKSTNYFSNATDAFAVLHLRDQVQKSTAIQPATNSPVWNETLSFSLPENPEDETLFVSLWGKHLITKNSFIGRVEIPICLVLERESSKSSDGWKQNSSVERWMKLLPKQGTNQFDQVTGWIQLRFSYTFAAYVPPQPKAEESLPPGSVLVFQCPKCNFLYRADVLAQHTILCTGSPIQGGLPPQISSQPFQSVPPNLHNTNPVKPLVKQSTCFEDSRPNNSPVNHSQPAKSLDDGCMFADSGPYTQSHKLPSNYDNRNPPHINHLGSSPIYSSILQSGRPDSPCQEEIIFAAPAYNVPY